MIAGQGYPPGVPKIHFFWGFWDGVGLWVGWWVCYAVSYISRPEGIPVDLRYDVAADNVVDRMREDLAETSGRLDGTWSYLEFGESEVHIFHQMLARCAESMNLRAKGFMLDVATGEQVHPFTTSEYGNREFRLYYRGARI